LGAWNTAIVNPKWLATEILKLPATHPYAVELQVDSTANIRAKIDRLLFIPTSDKLVISPTEDDPELFKLADQSMENLIATLPHTPIIAIGYNFNYLIPPDEKIAVDLNFNLSGLHNLYKGIGSSTSIKALIQHSLIFGKYNNLIMNISYSTDNGSFKIAMNYHYQINTDKNILPDAIGKFHEFYVHSQMSISKLTVKGAKH
jgi:hypothetical protein